MRRFKKSLLTLLACVAILGTTMGTSKGCMAKAVAATNVDSYYSSANTSSGEALIKSLTSIISNGHKAQGYDALFRCYKTSDVKPGTNEIWDMYSNCKFDVDKDHGASYKKEGDIYNREHTVPQSWFNKSNPMVCDAHHIYPTDGKVNGIRSSFLHGEVKPGTETYTSTNGCKLGSSSSSLYSGKVFEVPDEYKGDFARTYMYMATRYSSLVGGWGGEANKVFKGSFPYLSAYSIDMYTKWDAMDPVSEKEINRNEAVYKFQGNRNPFIDHPEYVSIIWPSKYNQNVTVDQAKVDAVIAKINALPAVDSLTIDNKDVVDAANAAYTALNYKEKQAVTNYSTLQAAVAKIAALGGDTPAPTPTELETISVSEALKIAQKLPAGQQTDKEYKITGKISGNIEEYNSQYGNATFDITDGTSTITVFRAKEGEGKANFTAASFAEKIAVNKYVVVIGNIKNFKPTNGESKLEINPCYLLSSSDVETPVDPTPVTPDPVNPDPVTPDPVDPTPTPTPKPTGEIKVEFGGLKTKSYENNYSFKIGEYSFLANVAFADSQYGSFVRIGSKKSPAIPTKFGISGNGGSLEMTFDVTNSTGITFNFGGQMNGSKITKWTILASTDGGSTWGKVADGAKVGTSLTATLAEAASSVRYALVVEGQDTRLDITSLDIAAVVEAKVNLSDVTTNKYLNVEYDIDGEAISNVVTDTVVVAHIDAEYQLDTVEYGVIYTEKDNLSKLIRLSYTEGNAEALAALVNGHYAEASYGTCDDGITVKALLEELDFNTTYVAVVVCEQNGRLVFANQSEINEKAMIEYYLDNNLITDAEQVSVLSSLLNA